MPPPKPSLIQRRSALHLLLGAPLLSACQSSAPSAQSSKTRVVSISPSTTETVFAIGAGHLLIGRSKYCDYPSEAARLPIVGGYSDPNIEAILGLLPTLVTGARGPAGPGIEQALNARGIQTFFPETESIAQIESMIAGLGRLLSHEEQAAQATWRIRQKERAVSIAVHNRPKIRAVMLFDIAPIVTAGPGSFPDELLRIAGTENLIVRGGAYPTINIEHLLSLDPDVLLDASSDAPDATQSRISAQLPGFRELRAVRENRVLKLTGSAVLRPGPRIGDGLETLAAALNGLSVQSPEKQP